MITPEQKNRLRSLKSKISSTEQVEHDAYSNVSKSLTKIKAELEGNLSKASSESSENIKSISEGMSALEKELGKLRGGAAEKTVILAKEIKKSKGQVTAFMQQEAEERNKLRSSVEALQKDLEDLIWMRSQNNNNGMHGGTTPNIIVSSTAPLNPNEGDLWVDTT